MPLATKSRAAPHHKKRQAGHHRKNKNYMKTYWPYIPMLLIVGLGLVLNSHLSKQSSVLGYQTNFSNPTLLNLTNQDRVDNGQKDLSLNTELETAAQNKANDIAAHNYWSHTSPSGQTPAQLLAASGYQFVASGENLAYGFSSASSVMSAWMNSPEHRANVLNSNYDQVGYGVSESSNFMGSGPKIIVVAEFAEPTSAGLATVPLQTSNLPSTQSVSRIQVITKSRSAELIVTAILAFGLAYLVLKHGIVIRKLVQRGELYAISHPTIDIAIVAAVMFCIVYSRSAGIIG
jgi:hypothetical protein